MAMQMPPQGQMTPAFAGQASQPFPGQSAPVRRDRTVRAPGVRGGHYRRVWSERKHKFYIKYGDAEGALRVRNTNTPTGAGANIDEQNTGQQGGEQEDPQARANQARERLFEGFYAILLEAVQIGPEGSGERTKGRAASFGDVTPLNGEIGVSRGDTLFLLLNENEQKIESIRRPISDEKKQKEFFCFMTAVYVVNEFLQKQKEGQGIPDIDQQNDSVEKSLLLSRSEKLPKELRSVRKSLKSVVKLGQQIEQKYIPIQGNIEQFAPSALPVQKMVALQKSLQGLRPANKKSSTPKTPLEKHLGTVSRVLDRLEKSWVEEEMLVKAQGNPLGRMRGVAGGGRSHSAVFRLPGRPPGTSQNLSVASPQMSGKPQRPPVKESKEDWKNHKDLKVGARVRVQHPHSHEKPVWGRIVAIGQDGVKVTEDNGRTMNIRWPHIHDIMPRLDNTPQNSFEMRKFGLPMENVPITQTHEQDLANRVLRRFGMPHNDDMIHDNHEQRQMAYAQLLESGAPMDPVESTRAKKEGKTPLDSFKGNLIDAAISRKVPVDPELLRKLPLEKVVEVLHYHFKEGEQ